MSLAIFKTNKIAILLATYNGEKYISEQIRSILKQSYNNWNLYIHDDGSNDRTLEIVESYQEKYPQNIYILENKKVGGAKNNFFYLMSKVKAPYYMFCDQDDVWMPNKIELTVGRMKENEKEKKNSPILIFSDLKVVDEKLKMISPKMSEYQNLNMYYTDIYHLMLQNVVTGCTCMINDRCKELALKCKNIEEVIMHDWWCGLIASYFGKIDYIDKPLIQYRQHTNNSVGAKNVRDVKYILYKTRDYANVRKSIQSTQRQIACFEETFDARDKVLLEYSMLSEKNKLERIHFFIKNNIWKKGLIRNIGLVVNC